MLAHLALRRVARQQQSAAVATATSSSRQHHHHVIITSSSASLRKVSGPRNLAHVHSTAARYADAKDVEIMQLRQQVEALTSNAERKGRVFSKVSIVTGGGGGLGQAQCIRLAEEGAIVHIWETDEKTGAETLALLGGPMSGKHRLDLVNVADEASVKDAVSRVEAQSGRINVLVNNAAVFVFESVESATEAQWDFSNDVLIKGTAFACKHVIPSMRAAGGGSIINFGSICGTRAHENFAVYNTAKAGLTNMTRSIAMDVAADGIRCNIVCPGAIFSGGTVAHAKADGIPLDDLVATLSKAHMIPRMGQPKEVADAVLFLASDESSFITAHPLMVDGGWAGKP